MEYLQVKTPFIEKWEKEVLLHDNGDFTDPILSQYIDYSKFQDAYTDKTVDENILKPKSNDFTKGTNKSIDKSTTNKKKRKLKEVTVESAPIVLPENSNYEVSENVRKEMHNAVEKRRRDKINTTITELKDLVPNCHQLASNKASILQHAAEYIKTLTNNNTELQLSNNKLQEQNNQLLTELTELYRTVWKPNKQHQLVSQQQLPEQQSPQQLQFQLQLQHQSQQHQFRPQQTITHVTPSQLPHAPSNLNNNNMNNNNMNNMNNLNNLNNMSENMNNIHPSYYMQQQPQQPHTFYHSDQY